MDGDPSRRARHFPGSDRPATALSAGQPRDPVGGKRARPADARIENAEQPALSGAGPESKAAH
jgi:hypothetical protein